MSEADQHPIVLAHQWQRQRQNLSTLSELAQSSRAEQEADVVHSITVSSPVTRIEAWLAEFDKLDREGSDLIDRLGGQQFTSTDLRAVLTNLTELDAENLRMTEQAGEMAEEIERLRTERDTAAARAATHG